ncbi:uncharacterized protein DEA37_0000969 [Paragonimus westermani]|uniref:Uncharacterized protein n=1 Tax=Paragonimus westermani TaxID=34504 RepID=A0A5J4NX43_9TREM|nr:uncharacterized protein DEA37_0000969 [Paragonimus westermani]
MSPMGINRTELPGRWKCLRTTKVQQRELQDKSDSLVDLAKLQTNVFEGVADISLRQDYFQQHLEGLERHLLEIRVPSTMRSAILYVGGDRALFELNIDWLTY